MLTVGDHDNVHGDDLRGEIAESWRRSRLCGIDPGLSIDSAIGLDSGPGPEGRLLRSSKPVLEGLFTQMQGSGITLVLGDGAGRIVARFADQGQTRRRLDRHGMMPGITCTEESVGTNAIGTALELRRGIAINGPEHYLESLKGLSCYGHPILHPVTGRAQGVVVIASLSGTANPLFAPLITRAVGDIESRLLEDARPADLRLVAEFRKACRGGGAVMGLSEDLTLSNAAASDLVDVQDHVRFRGLAYGVRPGRMRTVDTVLSGGSSVRVRMMALDDADADAGTIYRLTVLDQTDRRRSFEAVRPSAVGAADRADLGGPRMESAVDWPVAVCGEPGSGVTTQALRIAGGRDRAVILDAEDFDVIGWQEWSRQLTDAIHGAPDDQVPRTIIVERAGLLPDAQMRHLARMLKWTDADGRSSRVIVTAHSRTGSADEPAISDLLARCRGRVLVPALRERHAEFADLAEELLSEIAPAESVRLASSTSAVLMANPWPGNLTELRSVLSRACATRRSGTLEVSDLPVDYRLSGKVMRLSGMELAERNAIVAALTAAEGNKSRAAERLGIGRTTLYARMRMLDI